jgi:hypothetical protein
VVGGRGSYLFPAGSKYLPVRQAGSPHPCGFLCVLCDLCVERFSRFDTEDTEKAKKVVARVFRPGDFLARAAKFPASKEASYSSLDIPGKGNAYGPYGSYIPATDRRRDRAVVEVSPRAAPRRSGIFRPAVSPRAVVHAGGHLSGERQPHGSDSALHRARSGKAAGRARARRAAAGSGCGLYAPSP